LVVVTGRVRLDRHRFNVVGPRDLETCSRRQRGIDGRMQRPTAGIGLVGQRLAAESRAEVAEELRGVVPVRLVQLQKPETAAKNVARAGKTRFSPKLPRARRRSPLGRPASAWSVPRPECIGDCRRRGCRRCRRRPPSAPALGGSACRLPPWRRIPRSPRCDASLDRACSRARCGRKYPAPGRPPIGHPRPATPPRLSQVAITEPSTETPG